MWYSCQQKMRAFYNGLVHLHRVFITEARPGRHGGVSQQTDFRCRSDNRINFFEKVSRTWDGRGFLVVFLFIKFSLPPESFSVSASGIRAFLNI